MTDAPTIFGWALEQWRKAFDYFQVTGADDLFIKALTSVPDRDFRRSDEDLEAFSKLLTVQRDWRLKRRDQPADTIILADTYRARKDSENA
jgi:hypothetical protein